MIVENFDNRNYVYSLEETIREEYKVICEMVAPKSKVIDFGCGDGSLLKILEKKKNIQGVGYEISESAIEICKRKKLNVIKKSIDSYNYELKDQEFDFAICNVTIQMVMYPEILLEEMGRVAKYQIVSFPNFAYYKNRLDLLFLGRMPKPLLFGYEWFSTGHIHQLSINDFLNLCRKLNLKVIEFKTLPIVKSFWKKILLKKFSNLFTIIGIFKLCSEKINENA